MIPSHPVLRHEFLAVRQHVKALTFAERWCTGVGVDLYATTREFVAARWAPSTDILGFGTRRTETGRVSYRGVRSLPPRSR